MSHRGHSRNRPDPRDARLEQALRRALYLAAEAIDPGADGLDKIEAKILAQRYTHQLGRSGASLAGTEIVDPGLSGAGRLRGLTVGAWAFAYARLARAFGAVADRLRPEPGGQGAWGWLRPAAAVATGLFVVVAASWAVTALPAAISQSNNSTKLAGPGQGGPPLVSPSAPGTHPGGSHAGGTTRSPSPSPSPSPSCRSASAAPTTTPTSSPSVTPTPVATPTPSVSPTPTPTPSTSPTPVPSSSPTSTTAPGSTSPPAPSQGPSSLTSNVNVFIVQPHPAPGARSAAGATASPSPAHSGRHHKRSSPSPCPSV